MKTLECGTLLDRGSELALPLKARFAVAGSIWEVSSNAGEILEAMRGACEPAEDGPAGVDLFLSIFVDFSVSGEPPWPQPYYRSLDHLAYGAFGSGSSMLIDLQRRRVIASFSSAIANDQNYWKRVLVPMLLGTASAVMGITPLHCACLVRKGSGLLLGGASEAGKSTLALSLALRGFDYLSDDWTYFTRSGSQVYARGLPTPVKLLPDAVRHFPQLGTTDPAVSQNGELAFEVDPVEMFGVGRSLRCEPRWLVFLERTEESRIAFRRISSDEAASRLAADLEVLPACFSDAVDLQLKTIDVLVTRECWVLRHGLSPALIADELVDFCDPALAKP